jgi:uncharacterized protein
VPPIEANATSNLALWVGTIGSARGYKEEVRQHRHLLTWAIVVSLGGSLLGALLLLRTPERTFTRLIPYLLLFATLVFACAPLFTRRQPAQTGRQHSPLQLAAQFFTAVYGGYFGAGMGFVMLAILAFSGLPSLNAMNAIKNVLAVAINGIALVPFMIAGIIEWPQALLMAVGAAIGGYFGSRIARRLPAQLVRAAVIVIGVVMTAYFFIRR